MALPNTNIYMPKIVHYAGSKDRNTITMPAVDSSVMFLGSFVKDITGTAAAPDGVEYGVAQHVDDARILGFVVSIHREGSTISIFDDDDRAGTITAASGDVPAYYTFDDENDESNTTSAKNELVEIMPIVPGDILEVTLWGDATSPVNRATTTDWGTTDSSANIGVGLSVDTTYTFALTESGADNDLDDQDFMTTRINNKWPTNPRHVYAKCLRKSSTVTIVE